MGKPSVSTAVNNFAFDILKILSKMEGQKNVFFSPLSIFTCMNMATLGAKGKTAEELFVGLRCDKGVQDLDELHDEMKKVLERYEKEGLPYALYVANKVIVEKKEPVMGDYKDKVVSHYKASVAQVDFENQASNIIKEVNDWVKEQTRGLIDSIINEIPPLTKAILLNAVYFKGKWTTPFDPKDTKPDKFFQHGNKDAPKEVPFMSERGMKCTLKEYQIGKEKVQVLELPYQGDIAMCLVVPQAIDGIDGVLSAVNYPHDPEAGSYEISHKANVFLPKFKFETMYQLKPALQNLGLSTCFSTEADFSGIRGTRDIRISEVIHKAVIDVNEEGTEAAAVTGMMMTCCMMAPMRVAECRVNRPFIFYLKDTNTDLMLFMGVVRSL